MGTLYSFDVNNSTEWYSEVSLVSNHRGTKSYIKLSKNGKNVIYDTNGDKIFETIKEYPNVTNFNEYELKGETAFICSSYENFMDEDMDEEIEDLCLVNSKGFKITDIPFNTKRKLQSLYANEYEALSEEKRKKLGDMNKNEYANNKIFNLEFPEFDAITSISIKDDICLCL